MTQATGTRSAESFVDDSQHTYRLQDQALALPVQRAVFGVQQLADSGSIEPELRELVKIRASQINGCAYCLAMHWRDALRAGARIDRLATLTAWRETDWFTPRERAALAWTEALTNLPAHGVNDALYNACREVFSEQEMVDLSVNIVAINSWNRLAVGFSARPEAFERNGAQ